MISLRQSFLLSSLVIITTACAFAQQISPTLYQNMRWRMIGPHRGGRTVGVAGVPTHPNVFYIGVNNGGVWKTSDYGRTWSPIFDDQPTGSVGALAVAPSNPDIIYVGSGEGLQRPDLSVGDGVYKSTDGGATWRSMGLSDGQQIGAVLVDPRDPNRVFVAVVGHPYGANDERGVFRTTDGGQTWEQVLYEDENTGAIALAFSPSNPQVIYADLWSSRLGPWENGAWEGKTSGLYQSTNGGDDWTKLTRGLPTADDGLGRIGFAIAPSNPGRMYAVVDARELGGLYRSDDGGASWKLINADRRIWGRGSDFAEVKVHPKNPDVVFIANVVTWKSTDGGQSFTAFKGAPGGDDYHTIWINPDDPEIILLASDQGATISVNGGQTWSSWYNQPTAQFYHVITDNQFPYMVYGGQQECGSVAIASRGNSGEITFREWYSVGADEYAYIAPDPLNPNIIYASKASRFDRTTGQVQNIAPEAIRSGKYRYLRTMPLLFSPVNPRLLFLASNVLFKTSTGGNSWEVISPDLSQEAPDVPENIGVFRTAQLAKQPRRGVIYAVAPSYKDVNVIWAGTDDGLIHLTQDGGKNWHDVTPPGVTSWSKVAQLDAGRFDARTVYAAVNRIRLDDLRPHIFRTHDGGKSWKEIVSGLPQNEPVNTVREDPLRRGLLFAGTECAVYVSFNDGDNWQSLRLNMPASSVRDLVIHEDDIAVGTHGRSFWILDDITPLRQVGDQTAASDAFVFKPAAAYRVRWNNNTDTPLPPEEPAGTNPPDGAIIDYYLKSDAPEATLEIFDPTSKLVRRFSSADQPVLGDSSELNIPTYWIRPPKVLSPKAGMQRFVWDLHYAPPQGYKPWYPISAVVRNTAGLPLGPWVMPGEYSVRLTVNGKAYSQSLTVRMDPRVKTPRSGLNQQFTQSMKCYDGLRRINDAVGQIRKLRGQLGSLADRAVTQGGLKDSLKAFEKKLAELGGPGTESDIDIMYFSPQSSQRGEESLTGLQTKMMYLMMLLQSVDAIPTTQATAAIGEAEQSLKALVARWEDTKKKGVMRLNGQLRKAGLHQIE